MTHGIPTPSTVPAGPSAGPAPLQLRITSDPANLADVRHAVEEFCTACGFGYLPRGEIVLCVNEAMANITRHAYHGATDRPIQLDAEFSDGTVRIRLRDWGCGEAPPSWLPPKDPLQPGGVGMVCLRRLMDSVRYEPQPDGMLLILERKR